LNGGFCRLIDFAVLTNVSFTLQFLHLVLKLSFLGEDGVLAVDDLDEILSSLASICDAYAQIHSGLLLQLHSENWLFFQPASSEAFFAIFARVAA